VRNGKAYGVRLRSGEELFAESIVSNASLWDTYGTLLEPTDLPTGFVSQQLKTPTVESFMHLHLGINAEGLEHLEGHHVVVHDTQDDITRPGKWISANILFIAHCLLVVGNAVMISVASKFDPSLAPTGKHVVHAVSSISPHCPALFCILTYCLFALHSTRLNHSTAGSETLAIAI